MLVDFFLDSFCFEKEIQSTLSWVGRELERICEKLGEGEHDKKNHIIWKNSYLKENNWICFLCRTQSHRERVIGSCPLRDIAVGLRSCRVRKKSCEINDNLSQPKWVAVNEQYLSLLEKRGLQWAQSVVKGNSMGSHWGSIPCDFLGSGDTCWKTAFHSGIGHKYDTGSMQVYSS